MKLGPKQVRFLPVNAFLGRNGHYFVGRGNTLQLLETALVIEGNQKTLGLIVVDMLFRQALSEWTTVTIPYSRIVRCRYSRRLVRMIALLLAIFVPVALALGWALGSGGLGWNEILMIGVVLLLLLVPFGVAFTALYFFMDFGPRHELVYRRADGRLMRISFRIRARALRKAFTEQLEANRLVAARPAGKPPARGKRGEAASWQK